MKNNSNKIFCLLIFLGYLISNFKLQAAARITPTTEDRNELGCMLIDAVNKYKNVDINTKEKIEAILKNGADINFQDSKGNTALMTALRTDHITAAKLLIKLGADINIVNRNSNIDTYEDGTNYVDNRLSTNTALMIASQQNNEDMVELLIKNNADVNITNKYGDTSLFHAVCYHKYDYINCTSNVVNLLINANANVNAKNNKGENALSRIDLMQINSARLLIYAGADIDNRDNNGITPLYRAVTSYAIDIIKLFLLFGANIDLIYSIGKIIKNQTILDIARKIIDQPEIIKILENEQPRRNLEIENYKKNITIKIIESTDYKLNKDLAKIVSDYAVESYKDLVYIKKIEEINKDIDDIIFKAESVLKKASSCIAITNKLKRNFSEDSAEKEKDENIVGALLKASAELEKNKLKRKMEENNESTDINKKTKFSASAIKAQIIELNKKLKDLNAEMELLLKTSIDNPDKVDEKQDEIDEVNQQIKLLINMLKSTKKE